jgi:hypothetical protein
VCRARNDSQNQRSNENPAADTHGSQKTKDQMKRSGGRILVIRQAEQLIVRHSHLSRLSSGRSAKILQSIVRRWHNGSAL